MGVPLSTEDQKRYEEMVWLLHSLVYALTTKFLEDEKSRDKILQKLKKSGLSLLKITGCGNLCYDKERGCICCSGYGIVPDNG